MKEPKPLVQGDKIALIATAKHFDAKELSMVIALIESKGYKVVKGSNLLNKSNQWAGTDKERAADFQWAMQDAEIKAVWCYRGGYGSMRMLEHIDLDKTCKAAKWVLGFSDVTVLLAALHRMMIPSVHAPMPIGFSTATSTAIDSVFNVLEGRNNNYFFPSSVYNRGGDFSGEIIAGNLSMLMSISGTYYDYNYANKVLVLEDLCENKYHIDRMLLSLKMQGKFEALSGLIVGGFTDIEDNETPFGKEVEEMILERVPHSVPVVFNFPLGHIDDNRAVVVGRKGCIKIQKQGVCFIQ